MGKNFNRPLKLGMHTYTLHFWGFGESWGFGKDFCFPRTMSLIELMDQAVKWELDGLQITKVDLDNTSPSYLAEIKAAAQERDLFLEFNSSFQAGSDSRVNCTVEEALRITSALGSDLTKFSLDITRPRILYGSCFHPDVMRQLTDRYELFQKQIPLMEELGLKIAIENHTDTYADEVLWLVKQLDHHDVGTCIDTINSLMVLEGPEAAVEKLLPSAFCCHFSDDVIVIDPTGVHDLGVSSGQGSWDLAKILKRIREVSPMDSIIFENEIPFLHKDEPLEEARAREWKHCEDSIAYLRNELKLGVRNR
jgi:sugar phosphate isomerase/epimerase